MAKNDVQSWDTTAGNNTDVAGIDINEGCAAAGINNAIRAIMAEIAAWIVSATGPVIRTAANTIANAMSILDGYGTARTIGYRGLPLTAKTSGYTIALTDVGTLISTTTGGWTIPLNATVAFALGDTVTVYNNSSSSQTVTATGGVTLRLVGTSTTGNRTVGQRGFCTLVKVATDEWVASGGGVS
jgi:hypothetical protein